MARILCCRLVLRYVCCSRIYTRFPGFHLTIWAYRTKIYGILQEMHNLTQVCPKKMRHVPKNTIQDAILPPNRFVLEEYLDGIRNLDLILASIHPCTQSLDTHLADLAAAYVNSEENRLKVILDMLDYEIDGPDTISLIMGRHQIERVSTLVCVLSLCNINTYKSEYISRSVYSPQAAFRNFPYSSRSSPQPTGTNICPPFHKEYP